MVDYFVSGRRVRSMLCFPLNLCLMKLSNSNEEGCSFRPSLGRHPSVGGVGGSRGTGIESAGLNDFAKYALGQICSQQWIHERCLRDPDVLCSSDLLLDPMLSQKQVQSSLFYPCWELHCVQ